jgi:hypothetical protein
MNEQWRIKNWSSGATNSNFNSPLHKFMPTGGMMTQTRTKLSNSPHWYKSHSSWIDSVRVIHNKIAWQFQRNNQSCSTHRWETWKTAVCVLAGQRNDQIILILLISKGRHFLCHENANIGEQLFMACTSNFMTYLFRATTSEFTADLYTYSTVNLSSSPQMDSQNIRSKLYWPPLWSSGQSSWLQIQRSDFNSWHYQSFWEVVGLERDLLSLVNTIEELLRRKSSGSRNPRIRA